MNRDYQRIADALNFIDAHHQEQPTLDEVAAHLGMSPHHFHRMFVRYCGVTPKQFLQILTVNAAKQWLQESTSVDESAEHVGLSTGSRLFDHFVTIDAITPGEFKTQGKGLCFYWGHASTTFGEMFIAWTDKGIHRLSFIETDTSWQEELSALKLQWPAAECIHDNPHAQQHINQIENKQAIPLRLWVKGSNFQIKVWQGLLNIPTGHICSYQNLAKHIGRPSAARAVGSAIGSNPIAWLIPCHRVIQATGAIGGYRWQPTRKKILLAKEHWQIAQSGEKKITKGK